MIGSYIKTSGRNILKNKLFSAINIFGLAISLSVGLLMIAFISDLLSYDKFHRNGDRIYRVVSLHTNHQNRKVDLASTSVRAGKKIKETFTGLEAATLVRRGFTGDVHFEDNIFPMRGLWADESFFKVFTFPFLFGDARTALKDPYSVVLTETTSRRLFGKSESIGRTMKLYSGSDTTEFTVTGIIEDVPKSSQMQFEALASFSTRDLKEKNNTDFYDWGSVWMNYVYVLLPEAGSKETIELNLVKLSSEENKHAEHYSIQLSLQSLHDIVLGKDLANPIGPTMMISIVYILSGLAFVVILSACFNYTNLSIARALRRSREVSIRKVVGASKFHILGQFIVESVLVSLVALIFSFGLFLYLRLQFFSLGPAILNIVKLELTPRVIFYFFVFAIVVGIIAGLLPAFFFSKINAIQVMKSTSTMKVFGNVSLRKALLVLQYSFSLMFVTSTIIGYKQYKHFLTFDLGFNTANILNIELQGNKSELLLKELSELKEVELMSRSSMITSVGHYWGSVLYYNDRNDSIKVWYNMIDENYLPLHGHKFLAGVNFTPKTWKHEESEVIVTEKVLRHLNIANQDPDKALGEVVTLEKKQLRIVGILKDFHYGKVDSNIDPVIFRFSNEKHQFINAKISSTNWPATLAAIEMKWKKIDRAHPLKATFYDDQIAKAYSEYSVMIKVIGFLAFLAVAIASIGLLGMVVFTTETRLREISIRKVLGASESTLIYILSRGFFKLLLISAAISLPLTYIFFQQVVLSPIVYHAPISITDMALSVLVILLVALFMIGSQTLKAARSNPVDVLKVE